MPGIKLVLLLILLFSGGWRINAHDASAHYLGNEGVMVSHDGVKILFDPFFHNRFSHYTLVPEAIRQAIFLNKPPYNDINAIFISHAHGDHFDVSDVLNYLLSYDKVQLFAPQQAVRLLAAQAGFDKLKKRVHSLALDKGASPQNIAVENMIVEAVYIPHAGWPQRADVENIVYRVQLKNKIVVMHLGDADPDIKHFNEQRLFWSQRDTNMAFPPYWFALSLSGQKILDEVINAHKPVGIHVPSSVPDALKATKMDYFSNPGEERVIKK